MHALLDTFVKLIKDKKRKKTIKQNENRKLKRRNMSAMIKARLDQRTREITVQYRCDGTITFRTATSSDT